MNEENKWKEFSKDISNISNKVKDNLIDDENINDLKETMNSAKNSIKNNFSDLITAIEETVKDEEIKEDALNIVKKMRDEFSKSFENIKDKILTDGILTIDDGPIDITASDKTNIKPYTLMTTNTSTLPHGCLHISQPKDSSWNGWLHNQSTNTITNPVLFTSSKLNCGSSECVLETIPQYCAPNKDCAIGMLCEKE